MLNFTPTTSEERKQIFFELLYGKTSKINKVADNSVISGIASGIGKISGKADKDIALALSRLFADTAYGSQLDQIAQDNGVAPRFGVSQSSTFVRVVATPGTVYTAGLHTFTSLDGTQFDIETSKTIGAFGFDYIKVRSVGSGSNTNVPAGTITKINPIPVGHSFCVNEYQGQYGRDAESDAMFRQRIKQSPNLNATGTLSRIEQAFMLINPNVLECRYLGINDQGQIRIAIVTQNGIDLNSTELDDLLLKGERFFGLTELRPFGRKSYGIILSNIEYQPFDISFRCELNPSADPDVVRRIIQLNVSKYIDFRYFKSGIDKVEWDNLLQITKQADGMKYVPDTYFYPGTDIATDPNKLPRLRGFLMLDMNGSPINNFSGSYNPVYYPNEADFSFQQTALNSII